MSCDTWDEMGRKSGDMGRESDDMGRDGTKMGRDGTKMGRDGTKMGRESDEMGRKKRDCLFLILLDTFLLSILLYYTPFQKPY